MKKIILALALAVGGYGLFQQQLGRDGTHSAPAPVDQRAPAAATVPATDSLSRAFEQRRSNVQAAGSGTVVKVLKDDDDGSRHQRFLLQLPSGQTVLVAHNIDLAPRIADLHAGDSVAFTGEYEWNNKGGVIHWTHRDPAGRHASGWLEHAGRRYQ